MNLRLLLIICGTFHINAQTTQQPLKQDSDKIKLLAIVYTMLMDSFDPREVPIDVFLTSPENELEINEFALIIDNIYAHLDALNLPYQSQYDYFHTEVTKLQNSKDLKNRPLPYRMIRYYLRQHIPILFSNTRFDFCEVSDEHDETSNEQIHEAINKIVSTDNIDRDQRKIDFKIFPPKLTAHSKYKDGTKSLTLHHIISKRIINEFRIHSDSIVSSILREREFDYHRIRSHNFRKIAYPHIRSLYKRYAPKDDIDGPRSTRTRLEVDNNFKNFVKRLQLQPPGLLFLGPRPEERLDDPDQLRGNRRRDTEQKKIEKKKRQEWYRNRYGNYDPDFEYSSRSIVGSDYLDKVEELYKKIKSYNENENERTEERTKELMKELDNIYAYRRRYHIENDDLESVFFGWHPDEEWNYSEVTIQLNETLESTKEGWYAKTVEEMDENNSVRRAAELPRPGTSGYKAVLSTTTSSIPSTTFTASTTTEDILFGNLEVNERFKYFGGEFRRKRNHDVDDYDYECHNDKKKIKPNGFFCSPLYLRINPMQYFFCKWTGHQNLSFFRK